VPNHDERHRGERDQPVTGAEMPASRDLRDPLEASAASPVDCRDRDDAIEVAAQVPTARYGTIEARPVLEP
jgi:hypothetical protein